MEKALALMTRAQSLSRDGCRERGPFAVQLKVLMPQRRGLPKHSWRQKRVAQSLLSWLERAFVVPAFRVPQHPNSQTDTCRAGIQVSRKALEAARL